MVDLIGQTNDIGEALGSIDTKGGKGKWQGTIEDFSESESIRGQIGVDYESESHVESVYHGIRNAIGSLGLKKSIAVVKRNGSKPENASITLIDLEPVKETIKESEEVETPENLDEWTTKDLGKMKRLINEIND